MHYRIIDVILRSRNPYHWLKRYNIIKVKKISIQDSSNCTLYGNVEGVCHVEGSAMWDSKPLQSPYNPKELLLV